MQKLYREQIRSYIVVFYILLLKLCTFAEVMELKISTLKEIAHTMGCCTKTARKWIKENVPGIYDNNISRKSFFTKKEVEAIMKEFF